MYRGEGHRLARFAAIALPAMIRQEGEPQVRRVEAVAADEAADTDRPELSRHDVHAEAVEPIARDQPLGDIGLGIGDCPDATVPYVAEEAGVVEQRQHERGVR